MSRDTINLIRSFWEYAMPVLLLVCVVLLVKGLRRRQLDSHPHCAGCHYDLSGKPDDSHRCPECGLDLRAGDAIVSGTLRRRWQLVFAAVTLGILIFCADRGVTWLQNDLFQRAQRLLALINADDTAGVDAMLAYNPALIKDSRLPPGFFFSPAMKSYDGVLLARLLKEPLIATAVRQYSGDGFYESPLWQAIQFGSDRAVELLLDTGADPQQRGREGELPIHYVTLHRDGQQVLLLLDHGADAQQADRDGLMPIHLCFREWFNKSAAEALFDRGVSVDAKDSRGNTPLHITMGRGDYVASWWLLCRGADITLTNAKGKSPSESAVKAKHSWMVTEMWDRLIRQAVSAGHEQHASWLISSSKQWWTASANYTHPYPMQLPHQDNLRSYDKVCPPYLAVRIITMLLEHGFPIDTPDFHGSTLLHRAADYSNSEVFTYLVLNGANHEAANKNGKTPMHLWHSAQGDRLLKEALEARSRSVPGASPTTLPTTRVQSLE